MASYDYDLFTIGAGSGGVRGSRIAASLGARVAVAEDSELGGTCVNLGCIPKKLLVYASHVAEEREDAIAGFGWSVAEPEFDWATLIANKDKEIKRLNGVYDRMLVDAGVTIVPGRARLVDAHTVEVAGRRITAENILIAVGGWPFVPDFPGRELAITSNEVFHLDALPERVLVVGGGYIAVEFAGILHGLGSRVTQIYRRELFLRGFDDSVREALATEMKRKDIDLRFSLEATSIEKTEGGLRVALSDGSDIEVDQVLYATGRVPKTDDLGLEAAGVEVGPGGAIPVDAVSRTNVPNIFAIGDCTDRVNLTPVALHEGTCVAHTLFGDGERAPDHEYVASAVFSQPPIGSVGLTEAKARDRFGDDLAVYESRFRALKHTLTGSAEQTLMKLLVDRKSDAVVGLHMLGPDAGEITQGFAVAIKAGVTKSQFDQTIGIHPTAAEEFVTMREPTR